MMDYTQIFLSKIENIENLKENVDICSIWKKKKFIKKAPSEFHQYWFAEANLELLP